MEKLKFIGVGCFGKPERVVRLFNKISKDYNMIDIPCLSSLKNALGSESVQIAGFSLAYKNQGLRMSIFIKSALKKPAQTSSITYPIGLKKTRLQ